MERTLIQYLRKWRISAIRKPLILRGARQVGKTYLIKQFGEEFTSFVSINLEKQPEVAMLFNKDLNPKQLIQQLQLITEQKIIPGETLLFIDEAQAAPRSLIALRYFYEECPLLHVIAAGSLLDFAIEKVGIPVGRVSFLYLYPLSFIEFLRATKREIAAEAILKHPFPEAISESIHQKWLEYVGEYLAIGGMPEVVKVWQETRDIHACGEIQYVITESYKQDFEKYCKQHEVKYVSLLYEQVPRQLGKIFKFSKIPGEYRKRDLAPCFDLLSKAMVVNPIYHSDGHGLPLGAQADYRYFKAGFVDIALAQRLLNFHPKEWFLQPTQSLINKGEMTESFVGQELLAYSNPQEKPQLYYWQRHERGSSAEIDYLLNVHGQVIPIEVKSGAGSSLKSLQLFLKTHSSPYSIRFSTHPFSLHEKMHSYPLYAIAKLQSDFTGD
jgi:predicted AAA+ superfamily ATPase